MDISVWLQAIGLFLAGLLAGEEFVVRYGVQPALTRLDDRAHILARQALIRQLRVLVPSIMLPTVVVAIVAAIVAGDGTGAVFRWAGVVALAGFVAASFAGTVPINIRVIEWEVDAPPADWRAVISRWQQIDVLRSSLAIAAFALLCLAVVQQLAPPA